MANASVGGLYVAVTLDTKAAAAQLGAMGVIFAKAMAAGSASAAASNVAASASTAKLGKNAAVTTAQLTGMQLALSKVNKSATSLGSTAAAAGTKVSGTLGTAVGGVGGKLAIMGTGLAASTVGVAALAAAGIAAAVALGSVTVATYKLGKAGFNTATDLELLDVSLTAILGSADAAAAEMNALIDTAVESPFLTPVVIEMDKFLLSQGLVSAEIRGNLIPAILDMSAAYGLSSDNLRSISYAMAQVQSRGYLSGDELRQLANQLVPVWKILREIPEYANLSQTALRKLSEQGNISAETFQRAVISYAQQFDGAAEKAANTVQKLAENIRDITTIRLGKAFLDLEDIEGAESPLQVVRDLMISIKNIVKDIDFGPLASSMGNAVAAMTNHIQAFMDQYGQSIIDFFQQWLPVAINYAAQAIYIFTTVLKVGMSFIGTVFGAIGQVFGAFVGGVSKASSGWGNIWKALAAVAAIAGGTIIVIVQSVAAAVSALIGFLSGDRGGVRDSLNAFTDSFGAGADFIESSYRSMAKAIEAAGNIKVPDLSGLAEGISAYQDAVDDSPTASTGSGSGSASSAAKATADDIAKAMDVLYDLTIRWQGFRSELERGLLGDEGFTATMDQIIAMGKKVSDALLVIGDTAAADRVIAATLELYDLAQRRNEVAELLKQAEQDLAAIISERDNFTAAIRKSAISFAAALDLEEKVVQKWEQQSDRGFFSVTDTTETQSFTDSLEERGAALKQFYEDIKTLQAGGLNADLLRQLLEAGPEDGGGVASQLAAGGASMIGEANVLYEGIADTADELAALGAEEFYDAGVAEAQGLVDGLESQLAEIEAAAIAMGDIIYEEALTWAEEMYDAGVSAGGGGGGGGGFAGGVTASIPAAVHAAAVMANDTIHEFDGLGDEMYEQGAFGGESFSIGLDDGISDAVDTYINFLRQTDTFVGGLNLKFAGINPIEIVFGWVTIWEKMINGLKKLIGSLPSAVRFLFEGLDNIVWGANPFYYGSGRSGTFNASSTDFGASQLMTGDSAGTSTSIGYGQTSQVAGDGTPVVKVYIGDRELTDMIRTEVVVEDSNEATRVLLGRRV